MHSSSLSNRPGVSNDNPPLPPLFMGAKLPSKHILHGALVLISKGEEPTYVNATIRVGDQLVTTLENIHRWLELDHSTKLFKSKHEYAHVGMPLSRAQLVIAKHIPHKSLERERIPHLVHGEGGGDLREASGGSLDQFADTLVRERHLNNVLARLVASHEFHVRRTDVAGDVILGCLRQPPSFPRVSRGNKVGTPIGPPFLNNT